MKLTINTILCSCALIALAITAASAQTSYTFSGTCKPFFQRSIPAGDPGHTLGLSRVTVPTLALYGALDRAVDTAHDALALQKAFKNAGMSDFTLHIYPDAGHSLFVSQTGFPDQRSVPRRRVPGYVQVMIGWLEARGFTKDVATPL